MFLKEKILTLSPAIGENTKETIQNAYYMYSIAHSKTGLVELAVILSETKIGWIPKILNDSCETSLSQFCDLINHLKNTSAQDFVDRLHRFRKIRNQVKTSTPIADADFEDAFNIFLEFAEWYYAKYHKLKSIYDDEHYKDGFKKNDCLADRFKVLQCIEKNETHISYLVKDNSSSKDKIFCAKVPFVTHSNYDNFIRNEKRNHVMVQEHPNIERFYASYPIKPTGEVLIYEYNEGCTLKEWMEQHDFDEKTLADFLYIIGIVLNALEYIHKRNFVHSAILPKNIIITSNDGVKISGFEYCNTIRTNFTAYEEFIQKYLIDNKVQKRERLKDIDTYALGRIMQNFLANQPIPVIVKNFVEKACNIDSKETLIN